MLNHFRLITREQVTAIGNTPVIYALCFDVDGLLVRVGWSKYPGSRLEALLREQVVQPKEIWIADFRLDRVSDLDGFDPLRAFARRVHKTIDYARSGGELFRLPMAKIDAAIDMAAAARH